MHLNVGDCIYSILWHQRPWFGSFFCGTLWSVSTSPPMNSNNEYYKLRQITKDTIDGKAAMIRLTTRFVWITMEPCSTDDSMMSDFRSSIVSYCASWQMKHINFVDCWCIIAVSTQETCSTGLTGLGQDQRWDARETNWDLEKGFRFACRVDAWHRVWHAPGHG